MTLLCGSVDTPTGPEVAVRAMTAAWPSGLDPGFEWQGGRAALAASGEARGATDGATAIVADVRLDNRDELRHRLPGLDPASGDVVIVLASWRRWGAACCEHFRGDFAFAIWDDHQGRLFCGRDLVGAKPLYYWARPDGGFAFASQLGGLMGHPDLERRLDRPAAVEHLLFLHQDVERTLFAGVRRLPPGHALSFRPGERPRAWRHSELRPARLDATSLDGWAERLRTAVDEAVTDRLSTSGRLGAHVSGGLDSSAVAAVAASKLPGDRDRLVAISFSAEPGSTIGVDQPVDAPYNVAFSEHCRLRVHHAAFKLTLFPDALGLAAPGMFPPPYDTSATHRWAADLGVTTLLSGWGGDEAASFNGRSHPADSLRHGRLVHVARAVRRAASRRGTRAGAALLWRQAIWPNLPDSIVWWMGRRSGDLSFDRLPLSVVDERIGREVGAVDDLKHPLRTRPTTRATLLALLRNGHLVRRLEEWSADASRWGIDYRHPLLDARVLEVALAAPSEAFIRDGVPRWLFRHATAPYLPAVLAQRRDKSDSWTQRSLPVHGMANRQSPDGRWALAEAGRMLAEDDDLGGILDLAKLRRHVAGDFPEDVVRRMGPMPLFGVMATAQLAAFVAHNRMSV
jgi:asparagine synthase (glutamine-hydrolysing)